MSDPDDPGAGPEGATDDEAAPPAVDVRVESRSGSSAEEEAAGSDDPDAQARALLEDSDARQADRDAAPGAAVERRRSEDTVEPQG